MAAFNTAGTLYAQVGGYTLSYKLHAGDHHRFRLTTDQHIIRDRVIRLQSWIDLDVLEQDASGNYRCRVRFTADSARNGVDTFVYRPNGSFRFAGYRLYSELGGYDAVIDALGRILLGQSVVPREFEQATTTAFVATTDLDAATQPVVPYTVLFSLPRSTKRQPMSLGAEFTDTAYLPSAVQPITTSSGPTLPTSISRPIMLDTIVRTTTLDSVGVINSRRVGFITIRSMKTTVRHDRYSITTELIRDMDTGLLGSVREVCYLLTPDGQRLEYATTCIRVTADPFDPLVPPQQGVDGN